MRRVELNLRSDLSSRHQINKKKKKKKLKIEEGGVVLKGKGKGGSCNSFDQMQTPNAELVPVYMGFIENVCINLARKIAYYFTRMIPVSYHNVILCSNPICMR